MGDEKVKPKFDKKKWRTHKYSKKAKVDQWQEKRKKYMESKYFRMLQREGKLNNPNLEPIGNSSKPKEKKEKEAASPKKKSFRQTKEDFERRKKIAEKKQKADERRKKYEEKQEAIQKYKSKKAERFKVLSKKTSKGQPLMSGRIEMLLDKIKASET